MQAMFLVCLPSILMLPSLLFVDWCARIVTVAANQNSIAVYSITWKHSTGYPETLTHKRHLFCLPNDARLNRNEYRAETKYCRGV